jgi:hypothetical protein
MAQSYGDCARADVIADTGFRFCGAGGDPGQAAAEERNARAAPIKKSCRRACTGCHDAEAQHEIGQKPAAKKSKKFP